MRYICTVIYKGDGEASQFIVVVPLQNCCFEHFSENSKMCDQVSGLNRENESMFPF